MTGTANENQVREALRRYGDREGFVREALAHLHRLIANGDKPRPEILKVLPVVPPQRRVCHFLPARLRRRSAEATVVLISPMKRWLEP